METLYFFSVDALCFHHTSLQRLRIFTSVRPCNLQTVCAICFAMLCPYRLMSNKCTKYEGIHLYNILIYRILVSFFMKYHSDIYMKLEDAMACLSSRTSSLIRARNCPEDFKHAKLEDFNLMKVD